MATWASFKETNKDSLKSRIRSHRREITDAKARIKDAANSIKELQIAVNEVDTLCDGAILASKELRKLGKVRLDGRVGQAIDRRQLSTLTGLVSGFSMVESTFDGLKVQAQYWCDPWFADYTDKVPAGKRKEMYKRLLALAELDEDELQSEIGLMMLEVT